MDLKRQNEVLLKVIESQIDIIEDYSLRLLEAENLLDDLSGNVEALVGVIEDAEDNMDECIELLDEKQEIIETLTGVLESLGISVDVNEEDDEEDSDDCGCDACRMFGVIN